MAAKELYDYVDIAVADKDVTLTIKPQGVMTELGSKNDVIHEGDDNSEERIALGGVGNIIPYITIRFDLLNESDAGTVLMFYFDEDYGDGFTNSFKFDHPDGHTYVVRFASNMEREIDPVNYGVKLLRLKVLGRISD